MSWSESGESLCPIARCLAVVGDRWTMLIMRELFFGNCRFDGLLAQTGMSPHLLSTRLKRLEADGVLARRAYQDKPPRHEYVLTESGLDLYPVLMTMAQWGKQWGNRGDNRAGGPAADAPALTLTHRACGHEVRTGLACMACGEPFTRTDVDTAFSASFVEERRERMAAFQAAKKQA